MGRGLMEHCQSIYLPTADGENQVLYFTVTTANTDWRSSHDSTPKPYHQWPQDQRPQSHAGTSCDCPPTWHGGKPLSDSSTLQLTIFQCNIPGHDKVEVCRAWKTVHSPDDNTNDDKLIWGLLVRPDSRSQVLEQSTNKCTQRVICHFFLDWWNRCHVISETSLLSPTKPEERTFGQHTLYADGSHIGSHREGVLL